MGFFLYLDGFKSETYTLYICNEIKWFVLVQHTSTLQLLLLKRTINEHNENKKFKIVSARTTVVLVLDFLFLQFWTRENNNIYIHTKKFYFLAHEKNWGIFKILSSNVFSLQKIEVSSN